jgi:pepF/M3 family oligoendopeptidase
MSPQTSAPNTLPHWELSNIYPDLESAAFSGAVEQLKGQLDDLEAYLESQIAPEATPAAEAAALAGVIGGYLERHNAALRLYRTLHAYLYAHVTTDSYNTAARRLLSESEMSGVRLHQLGVRFQAWIGRVAPRLPQILAEPGPAREHAFYLQELAEQSHYLMSEGEESLAAELALSGAKAWQKLQGTVCSQLKVPFERDGRVEELPITALQNLRSDPDGEVRRRAHDAELAAWESVREPLAAALNGVKGAVGTLDRRRGRDDALHAALDLSRVDRATLETMLGAMQEAFPVFRQYLQAKAARLGKEALPWWDLFAPTGQVDRRFTFPEARDFTVAQFSTFSERLAGFARRAFENGWIDAEPRDGKQGGAFCLGVPGVEESRVLCNFDGSLDQVFTLAHELGHAYHNACRVGKTVLQRITPMTLAETASIFCETIVTDAMLAEATSPEEELAILETFLIGATQVIVDITSRYLFEKEVFERRAQSELAADDFCETMLRAQKATYGEGLDQRYLHPYMWAWKPHYYRPTLSFYNYPYAFGLLFGLGLYAVYQERGDAFLPEYDALLASTGEGMAADLAAGFGIDIRQPGFWQNSLDVIGARVQRYLAL